MDFVYLYFNLLKGQVEQIDGLSFDLSALAQVLEDDSRRVIAQQKSFQLHFESTGDLSKIITRTSTEIKSFTRGFGVLGFWGFGTNSQMLINF